jgi:hypothetical protein
MAIYRTILIVLTAACAMGAFVAGRLALMTAVMAFDALRLLRPLATNSAATRMTRQHSIRLGNGGCREGY